MKRLLARSTSAQTAHTLICDLQNQLVKALESMSADVGQNMAFEAIEWGRDGGQHGGGVRFVAENTPVFNRASVNMSQVQYEDLPEKKLASATALSTIVHPHHPLAPSMHMHISWTELKSGEGYWRIMADLNPATPQQGHAERFSQALQSVALEHYETAREQGDKYFYIPALKRHRGVSHFYLEKFNSGDAEADLALARAVGEAVISLYPRLIQEIMNAAVSWSAEDKRAQLDYHSLYFFQVLTLDRGTTSGLLVHDQNDVGILGSLPSHVNKSLLADWLEHLHALQRPLLESLLQVLPDRVPSPISQGTKVKLAQALRQFYQENPRAMSLQAHGDIVPPTVSNHTSPGGPS